MALADIIPAKTLKIVVMIGLSGGMVAVANGQSWLQAAKVAASDGKAYDYFGKVVSGLSSSAFAAGASGSVYVFTSSNGVSWVQSDKVFSSDGEYADDYFGKVVSGLSNSTFAAGAYGDDDMGATSGSVYVFTSSNGVSWVQSDKIVASDGKAYEYFGAAVSGLSSSAFAVGAHSDDELASRSGSVYVFTSSNGDSWVQSDKVVASDGKAYDYFGEVVSSLSSSAFTVAAVRDDDLGSNSGSVYVFTSSNGVSWVQSGKVVASDGKAYDYFGRAVSGLSSNAFAVGAYYNDYYDGIYSSSGSVYVFSSSNGVSWVQSDKVVASDGKAYDYFGDYFGKVVSGLSSSAFAVGACGDDDMGVNSGSVYVFTSSNGVSWVQSDKVFSSDGEYSEYFGAAVSGLSNSTFAAGAYGDDDMGSNSGSVYIFTYGWWCKSDSECSNPEPVCSGYVCTACGADSDCSSGICLASGACGECDSDSECSNSVPVCSNYACTGCGSDSDCSSGICFASGACTECDIDSEYNECSNPEPVCSDYACTGCGSDSDCSRGSCLVSGACGECDSDIECSNPKPLCSEYFCTGCGSDSDCYSGSCKVSGVYGQCCWIVILLIIFVLLLL